MDALRRGFKTKAERIATAMRAELQLDLSDRLDCLKLADHLGIPVIALRELANDGASATSIRRMLAADAKFSAMTLCIGTRRLIVYNPIHSVGRRANSRAHELSHVILEHPPSHQIGDGGCRMWNARLEAEADWLAGALLVPREGALRWMRNDGTVDGAVSFGVSTALFRWRVNQTGVAKQLNASRRRIG
jgi:Zn-dependent peptidase ImmA (M78 family)